MNKHGFTLAELLITIAILGVLAAIAIPHYMQNESAKVSEAISQLNAINLGEQTYRQSTGVFSPCLSADQSGCWATINVDDPESNSNRSFDYEVVSASPNTTFCAVATRRIASALTVCMNNAGTYSGTHPNGPTPGSSSSGGCFGVTNC